MNPNNVKIFIYTEREGVLSPVGHYLKLEVTRFEVDYDGGAVEVSVESDSVKVAGCIVDGNLGTVSASDTKTIEKNINKDVLKSKKHRHIDFRGTIDVNGDEQVVSGDLDLLGNSHQVEFRLQRDGDKWKGDAVIDQRDYGIKPFTAFLGALRIKPEIRIEVIADA